MKDMSVHEGDNPGNVYREGVDSESERRRTVVPKLALEGILPYTEIDQYEVYNTQIARIEERWMGQPPLEPHTASQEEVSHKRKVEDSKEVMLALETLYCIGGQ